MVRAQPFGRANMSSQVTSLTQLRLYLGAFHPVLEKAPPSTVCCDLATFPDTTLRPALSEGQENRHRGHLRQPPISNGSGAGNR